MALGENSSGAVLVPIQYAGRTVRKKSSGLGAGLRTQSPKPQGKSLASNAFGAPYGKGHPNKVPGIKIRSAARPKGLRRR